jgi:hypothetical protein
MISKHLLAAALFAATTITASAQTVDSYIHPNQDGSATVTGPDGLVQGRLTPNSMIAIL